MALARRLAPLAAVLISGLTAAGLSPGTSPPASYQAWPLLAAPPAFHDVALRPLVNLADWTRWAPVLQGTVARHEPALDSPAVGFVPARTPEGTTNIVVADGESERHRITWVRVGLAVLPNGTEGWVPRRRLGGWTFVDSRLVISRAGLTATLFRDGHVVFRARVGVGNPATPTPSGTFYVRDRLSGFTSPMYGPLAFGINARSATLTDWPAGGFIGLHGTDRPDLIPGRVSHGCVRFTNSAILKLGRLMPIGTPVTIT